MTTICVCLAKDPLRRIFAFEPGERIHIHISFNQEQIPDYYRLRILDGRRNSRLNRYGKGSSEVVLLNWPIPKTIREEHLGVWQVWINDRTDEEKSFGQFFFVEQKLRSESPLLEGIEIFQLPEGMFEIPVGIQDEISVPKEVVPIISKEVAVEEVVSANGLEESHIAETTDVYVEAEGAFKSNTSVTAIKGLGKTYADRLARISVYSISEFWYYANREHLAEIMRISDNKLTHMLQDAEILLSQEAEKSGIPIEEGITELIPDDLLSIQGIGQSSVNRLIAIGIKSKSDLLDYENLAKLQKILRMSKSRLEKILASIGRIIPPEELTEIKPTDLFILPVTNIKGIGVKSAEKLNLNGIVTVQDLLNSDYSKLNNIPKASYLRWKKNAILLTSKQIDKEISGAEKYEKITDLTAIPGIGVKTAKIMKNIGIETFEELLKYTDLDELAKKSKFSKKRLLTWQSYAKKFI